jgi:integrase/recombinase XerC
VSPVGKHSVPFVPNGVFRRAYAVLSRLTPRHVSIRGSISALNYASVGRESASQARMYSAWTSWCQHLLRIEAIDANPMHSPLVERPRVGKTLPAPFQQSDVETVLATIATIDETARNPFPARDLASAVLLISAGLRNSEICQLPDRSVVINESHLEKSLVRVRGKGRKDRVLPLSAAPPSKILANYRRERDSRFGSRLATAADEPFIVRGDGGFYTDRALRKLVDKWYRRAGIPSPVGHTVHAWRHSFATWHVEENTPLPVLQTLLGHDSLATTQVYVHVANEAAAIAAATHPSVRMLSEINITPPPDD